MHFKSAGDLALNALNPSKSIPNHTPDPQQELNWYREGNKYSPLLELKNIGVPEEYWDANLKDCNQPTEILSQFKEICLHGKGFLTLAGKPGRGKTYAACAMLKVLVQRLGEGFFISYPTLYQEFLKEFKQFGCALGLLEKLDHKVLVLDDFASRKPSDSFGDFIYMLVDARKTRSKNVTILTTNESCKTLAQFFGEPLLSRLLSGKVIKIEGEDRRINVF